MGGDVHGVRVGPWACGRQIERERVLGALEPGAIGDHVRLSVNLTAVLPLPKRSYTTPSRGEMSFQAGTSLIWGHVWKGMPNSVAGPLVLRAAYTAY